MKIAEKITDLIGKTPLVKINKLNENGNATIVAKLESFNPAHSIKDRVALNICQLLLSDSALPPVFSYVFGNVQLH